MALPKMTAKPSVGKDVQTIRLFYTADVSVLSTTSVTNCLFLSLKLNTCIFYNLTILLLGIYSNKLSIYEHRTSCTEMSLAALFVIATCGNNKNVHQHSMDEHSLCLCNGVLYSTGK